jgi:hypothetical protein
LDAIAFLLYNLFLPQFSPYSLVLRCGSFPLDKTLEEIAIVIAQTFPQFPEILAASLQ